MKVIIAALTAVSVLAGTTAPTRAGPASEGYQRQAYEVTHRHVRKKYKKRHYRHYRYSQTGQPQYWADKLPYGSQIWWQQMDREGRGGRRR
jgi:hypothetical protein